MDSCSADQNPAAVRSWIVELTATGLKKAQHAHPPTVALYEQLDEALAQQGLDSNHVRHVLLGLSAALRTLLPDGDRRSQSDSPRPANQAASC